MKILKGVCKRVVGKFFRKPCRNVKMYESYKDALVECGKTGGGGRHHMKILNSVQ
jgi:hypothetical protein